MAEWWRTNGRKQSNDYTVTESLLCGNKKYVWKYLMRKLK